MNGFTFDSFYAETPEEQIDGVAIWAWDDMSRLHANAAGARLRRAKHFYIAGERVKHHTGSFEDYHAARAWNEAVQGYGNAFLAQMGMSG